MTYSSAISRQRNGYAKRNHNAVTFVAAEKTLGPISNTVILIVLACLIGLLYLTQVTRTNSYGYTINDLQKQQSELQNQKADLEVTAARLQSLDRVAQASAKQGLVSVAPSGSVNQ